MRRRDDLGVIVLSGLMAALPVVGCSSNGGNGAGSGANLGPGDGGPSTGDAAKDPLGTASQGECDNGDPLCQLDRIGSGQEQPWEPNEDNSEGLRMDEEMGGLVLDSTSINTNLIWVANTGEGSVSKVDVRTFEELGRYSTGHDPSRTSVNSAGDVYVGNRAGYSLTKISALGTECPDTNGDGVVTTSSGHDVLAWGQDDCVLCERI